MSMIKLTVGAAEVLVFLLILVACAYLIYVGVRLWDRFRARRMVQRVMKAKDPKEHL
jgi:threonine/homoserine/homoserine lactone efflux protein